MHNFSSLFKQINVKKKEKRWENKFCSALTNNENRFRSCLRAFFSFSLALLLCSFYKRFMTDWNQMSRNWWRWRKIVYFQHDELTMCTPFTWLNINNSIILDCIVYVCLHEWKTIASNSFIEFWFYDSRFFFRKQWKNFSLFISSEH